jgi:hypothetical protein
LADPRRHKVVSPRITMFLETGSARLVHFRVLYAAGARAA